MKMDGMFKKICDDVRLWNKVKVIRKMYHKNIVEPQTKINSHKTKIMLIMRLTNARL